MNPITATTLDFLTFLLPGFITVAVIYLLTSHPKPEAFERIIQALIFTMGLQLLVGPFGYFSTTAMSEFWRHAAPMGCGATLGIMLAAAINHDLLHGFFRRLFITKENSHSSEWYSAFSRHPSYIVLHLSENRRLMGYPEEWPSNPDFGHFLIYDCQWIDAKGNTTSVPGANKILVPVTEISMVEFVSSGKSP